MAGPLSVPTVVGFGAVAVDELIYVDRPYRSGKARIVNRQTSYGGNIATALAAVASLGGSARYVGYLPDADQWTGLHKDLSSLGVDISAARVVPGNAPIRSTILITPDGERFIAFDDHTLLGAPMDLDVRLFRGAGVLLVDGYGAAAGLRAVTAASHCGIPTVGDFELDQPDLAPLIAAVGHLVVPLGYAATLSTQSTPHRAASALWSSARQAVVVTDGANGSWFVEEQGGPVQHVPSFEVDVVDTSGCGDVFHGAYALAVASGWSVGPAVRYASAAAAICATGVGGRGRLPRAADISALNAVVKDRS